VDAERGSRERRKGMRCEKWMGKVAEEKMEGSGRALDRLALRMWREVC
jgi:hypothetical protein